MRKLLRSLLELRLFYKVLVANATIVALVALIVSVLLASTQVLAPARAFDIGAVILLTALLPAILLNAVTLRFALEPMDRLKTAVARVRIGDTSARAVVSSFADREQRAVVTTFNEMLDAAEQARALLQELAARTVAAAENERQRIALELHDDVAQSLAAVLLRLKL